MIIKKSQTFNRLIRSIPKCVTVLILSGGLKGKPHRERSGQESQFHWQVGERAGEQGGIFLAGEDHRASVSVCVAVSLSHLEMLPPDTMYHPWMGTGAFPARTRGWDLDGKTRETFSALK